MTMSILFGIVGLIALVAFIVFAFRQALKVKKKPEGTPPDYSGGYSP
jgi:O-antigen ligase